MNKFADIGTLLFAIVFLTCAAMVTASYASRKSLPESNHRHASRFLRYFLGNYHGTFTQGAVTSIAYASIAALLVNSYLPIATVTVRTIASVGVTALGFGVLTEAFNVLLRSNSNRVKPAILSLSVIVELTVFPVTFLVNRLNQWLSSSTRRKVMVAPHFDPVVSSAMRITERSRTGKDEQDPPIIDLGAGRLVVDANLPISDLGRYLGMELPNPKSYPSIERLVVEEFGAVPPIGTVIRQYGFDFVVCERDVNRVTKVEIHRQFSLKDTFNPHSNRPSPESEP
jgi:Transporter associated domain